MIFMTGRDRLEGTSAQQLINAAALSAGLKLENPRFADITSDGDPYVVTALSALPDEHRRTGSNSRNRMQNCVCRTGWY